MRQYMKQYIEEIDKMIEENETITTEQLADHVTKLSFFQQERLVHLLVTLAYGLFLVLSLIVVNYMIGFIFVIFLIICLLIPYIYHYFALENGVQYMYRQYDRMKQKQK